ncbi:hypothetical protein LAG90_13775 [Marinilongibacter aquaticus]|uniref:hypothetical protein n=1 Tax=Marinilongibacter aquaticus TaxID=2975157 RepID=UPI0021BDD5B8|nr:hypothetical protein [Marinilongibacter aquaticus]UBM57874.1 hypothetical protein LAG90_13775 [Marinilongibacter aquaticus]
MKAQRIIPLFVLILFSCHREKSHLQIEKGIYHWKSSYSPKANSLAQCARLGIEKQYIRLFDIDWLNGKAEALSILHFDQAAPENFVPVIYITNRVFRQLPAADIEHFAKQVAQKIETFAQKHAFKFQEIQLDCDWSESTRNAYFQFSKVFKSQFPESLTLSATIRLHQIKFMEKTGIPPIDRGILMLYNVGDWRRLETKNSLFDPEIIDQYISRIPEYPIPLDIALPIYSQLIVYRQKRFFSFLKNTEIENLKKHLTLEKLEETNYWQVIENGHFDQKSFRPGDTVREEHVAFATLRAVQKAVLKGIQNKTCRVILFDLDENSLSHYSEKEYNTLFTYSK